MLENAYLTTGLVLGAAGLVVPFTRNLMLGSVKHDWLVDELEFDYIHTDQTTVHLKNGSMFCAFSLKGQPYETKPTEQQENLLKSRSDLIHQIGEVGVKVRLIGVKRQQDVSFNAEWPSPTLKEIGDAEQSVYQNSFFSYWYILLESKDYSLLEKASNKVTTILADYGCKGVLRSENGSDCHLTGLLNYLICGELRRDLLNVSKNISANIPASDLAFHDNGIIESQTPTTHYNKVIAIRAWPEQLQGMIISEVMALTGDIEVSQILVPLHNEKTVAGLMRKANEHKTGLIGNAHYAAENKAVAELLSTNQATLYETQFQIVARAETKTTLDALIKEISETLSRRRVTFSVETEAASVCWFNRIPGHKLPLVRPLRLINENIAALWPFQFSPRGQLSSPFGDKPIRLFKTPTGQSYAFQFHVSDRKQSPGNYLIFAPTGGGKSTLVMHLLGGLAKFENVRNYVFDSKEGAKYMVEALGGIYQSYENLSLNPLDVLVRNKTTEHQINMTIRAMLGDSYTEDMDEHIDHTINTALDLPSDQRTFNAIYEYAFPKDTPIRKAFAKWITDRKGKQGLYSHVFNSPKDKMSGFLEQSYLVGINMNEALEDPYLGAPVVAHIATAISKAAQRNHSGFSIFVDEAANLLRNKGFRDVVLQMYREYRKMNGLVGLAFQDPAALLKFEDHQGIINNTQTLIFLPNSLVRHDDLEPFNLNTEQKNFITGGGHLGGGRQVLIVKRDMTTGYDESAILDVDLSNLGEALRFYRAGTEANASLEDTKEKWGAEWLNHI